MITTAEYPSLVARKNRLLAQIRDLRAASGKPTPAQIRERQAYEAALRNLEFDIQFVHLTNLYRRGK